MKTLNPILFAVKPAALLLAGLALELGGSSARAQTPPRLAITRQSTNTLISFAGRLQRAAAVNGPYTNVPGAMTPYAVPTGTEPAGFWRARRDTNLDPTAVSQRLAAGYDHNLVIREDGTLWAWGGNSVGQLGDGTYADHDEPVQVGTNTNWKAVAAGARISFGLRTDGTLWKWGYGRYLELVQSAPNVSQPVQVGMASDWKVVTTSWFHAFGIRSNGAFQFVAFGNGYQNASEGASITNWKAVATGRFHSAGIREDGSLWTWGDSKYVGQGEWALQSSYWPPHQVGTNKNWKSVAIATPTSFGTFGGQTLALRDDGTIWTWGYNYRGELGVGTNNGWVYSPLQVGTNSNWRAIATRLDHSVGIQEDGSLWTWGYNGYGKLGEWSRLSVNQPSAQGTNASWLAVAAGYRHSLALREDGSLWSSGDDTWGQLGDGAVFDQRLPMQVGTSDTWTSISAGASTTVGTDSSGALFFWGGGFSSPKDLEYRGPMEPMRVGVDSGWHTVSAGEGASAVMRKDTTLWELTITATTPFTLQPTPISTNAHWKDVAAPFALKADGTLWSFDSGTHSLMRVGTNSDWLSVAATGASLGYGHALGIRSNGTLWAWGENSYGQLGVGSTSGANQPVRVGTNSNWTKVAAGSYHSIALQSDGTLWAWGANWDGQVGDGTFANQSQPVRIGTAADWSVIEAGGDHSVALRRDGTLWSWGLNDVGQLGDGTRLKRNQPTQIGTGWNWLSVSAGSGHTVALKADGTLWSWGDNQYGQLGVAVPTFHQVRGGPVWGAASP